MIVHLLGADVDDPIDGLRGAVRMKCTEDEDARFRRREAKLNRFVVAHFADDDDVRRLAERGPQGGGERLRVLADLALGDHALERLVHELDRILDRDDVAAGGAVDLVDDRRQRRRSCPSPSGR